MKKTHFLLTGAILVTCLANAGMAQSRGNPNPPRNNANNAGNTNSIGNVGTAGGVNRPQAPNTQPNTNAMNAANSGIPQQGQLQPGQPQQGLDNQGPKNLNPTARAPLPAETQRTVELWLDKWQQQTDRIERYACKFKRWHFNQGGSSGKLHETVSIGELKYMKPDKGVFKVDELYTFQPSEGKPDWKTNDNMFGEWWICNGQSIFEFDRREKIAVEFELPPDMQGLQIADSPLPFVFGVDKIKVLQRYYIEPGVTPVGPDNKPRKDIVALDAFPKRLDDSLNYQKVTIFLNYSTTLPVGIIVYLPESRPELEVKDVYEFTDEQINATMMDKLRETFMASFIPNPPKDYKVVKRAYEPPAAGGPEIPNQLLQNQTPPGQRPGANPPPPGNQRPPNGQRVAQPPQPQNRNR